MENQPCQLNHRDDGNPLKTSTVCIYTQTSPTKTNKQKNPAAGTSLEVQRLRLHASTLSTQAAQVQPLRELRGTKISCAPRLGQNKQTKTKPNFLPSTTSPLQTLLPRSFSSSPEVHSQPQRDSCMYEGL